MDAAELGTSKTTGGEGQGSHNKPISCGASESHAPGLDKEEELDALISQIYSWNEILHVSDCSSVHHQEFFTVNTAMIYVSKTV
jgi:hypothetical protein